MLNFKNISLIFLLLSFINISFATSPLPFNSQLKDLIEVTFMESGDEVSLKKINEFRKNILKRQHEVKSVMKNYLRKYEDKSKSKTAKKIKNEELIFTYDLILENLSKLESTTDSTVAGLLAQRILELDFSTKVEGVRTSLALTVSHAYESLKNWKISKTEAPDGEASNLVDDKTGEFYTQKELVQMKQSGIDISTLNPPAKGSFWTKQNIENLDVKDVYNGGNSTLYRGVNLEFPAGTGVFKKVRKTQSKPKLDITTEINGKKTTFKLKFGSEMHSEITTASMIATLGYNFDVSKYYRDFKMVLPEETSLKDFLKEYNSYYSSWPIKKYIKKTGTDKDGREFIVFYEVLVEKKPDEIKRIGPWAWGNIGHRGDRAARGFLIYNMWVANLDLKEAENNKLALKPLGNGEYSIHHYQHDMGFAFGKIFREKPGAYEWDLVKKITKDDIHVNFSNFQKNSGFKHVTYSDAKWMTRLISRLSREQIEDAVALGGWPKSIDKLLVEKLIARRNQLVKAFDLTGEIKSIPFERNLTTTDGVIKNGRLTKSSFEGYTQEFNGEWNEILKPIYEGFQNLIVQAALTATSSFNEILFDSDGIITDANEANQTFGNVKITTTRRIVPNPNPTGRADNYLVQDKLDLRFGIEAGAILNVGAFYKRQYKMVYPVATKKEGRFHNKFIFNALLPWQVRKGQLPEDYVLIMEDSFEGRGGVEISRGGAPLGARLSNSLIKLSRSVIAKQPGAIKLYQDKSVYNELSQKIYAELLALRVPFLNSSQSRGKLGRDVYEIEYDIENEKETKLKKEAIDHYVLTGSLSKVKPLAKFSTLKTNFTVKKLKFNLLNLVTSKNNRRVDNILQVILDENENAQQFSRFQFKREHSNNFFVIANGEEKYRRVSFASDVVNGRIADPMIHMELRLSDYNTFSKELGGYIKFASKLSNDKDIIDFTPSIHTKNNLWGITHMNINLFFNEKAMETLINTDESVYWKVFTQNTGMDANERERLLKFSKVGTLREQYLIKRMRRIINQFKLAKLEKNDKEKYTIISDAIYTAAYKSRESFSPYILSVLNSIVSKKNRYLSVLITQDEGAEMKYPARTPLYNEKGKSMSPKRSFFEFEFSNPIDVWRIKSNRF